MGLYVRFLGLEVPFVFATMSAFPRQNAVTKWMPTHQPAWF